jgi:hypothetical protein
MLLSATMAKIRSMALREGRTGPIVEGSTGSEGVRCLGNRDALVTGRGPGGFNNPGSNLSIVPTLLTAQLPST